MWQLFGAGNFARAYRSSQGYRGLVDSQFQAPGRDLQLAEGVLVAMAAVTPFWISIALLIHHLTA